MAVTFYKKAKEKFSDGSFDILTNGLRVSTVTSEHTPDYDNDLTTADLDHVVTDAVTSLTNVIASGGQVFADDYDFISISGAEIISKVILYHPGDNSLIATYDASYVFVDGNGFTVKWTDGIVFQIT